MRGAPARAIQELAGHQDLTTTQRYMHLSPAALASAIRLLESPGIPRNCEDILETTHYSNSGPSLFTTTRREGTRNPNPPAYGDFLADEGDEDENARMRQEAVAVAMEFPGFSGQTLASRFSRRSDAEVQAPDPG